MFFQGNFGLFGTRRCFNRAILTLLEHDGVLLGPDFKNMALLEAGTPARPINENLI